MYGISIEMDTGTRAFVLGTQSKKIEKFGGFILKGGSFQVPNFIIPLIWDILVRREGVKNLISQILW